ncbi:hypothetical protein BDV29DRAFT_174509 [Aspergillus leporis]|jgi:hypothetical protein|uniref:Uncharacterized protein n=1 Tax=Aspergillus leporis TaxID=41062 RepID=A0A5N5X3R9_9EURO|nr:hypothetical protein BDV29DRAFT_174509 [Aspergillus leporis]
MIQQQHEAKSSSNRINCQMNQWQVFLEPPHPQLLSSHAFTLLDFSGERGDTERGVLVTLFSHLISFMTVVHLTADFFFFYCRAMHVCHTHSFHV